MIRKLDNAPNGRTITLHDPATKESITVKLWECDESETALGINSRHNKSMKDQKKCLRDKANEWAEQEMPLDEGRRQQQLLQLAPPS